MLFRTLRIVACVVLFPALLAACGEKKVDNPFDAAEQQLIEEFEPFTTINFDVVPGGLCSGPTINPKSCSFMLRDRLVGSGTFCAVPLDQVVYPAGDPATAIQRIMYYYGSRVAQSATTESAATTALQKAHNDVCPLRQQLALLSTRIPGPE